MDTVDSAFGGEVSIVQPAKGYRFSVEAPLLARFAALRGGKSMVDLGCGSGIIGMCLLQLLPEATLVGIDLMAEHITRARAGASLNGWSGRARFEVCDVRRAFDCLAKSKADLVVSNPPFRSPDSSKISPNESVAVARNELHGRLRDFTDAAAFALRRGGSLCVVYPASRLDYLLESVLASGLCPATLRFIHPRNGIKASFVLCHAVKGAVQGITVESPLFLHGESGDARKYSEEAEGLIGPCPQGGEA